MKIVSTHRTLPTRPHPVCCMKTTRQVSLLKILMKTMIEMAVILRPVLKTVTIAILKPCMIWFTSQNAIFQLCQGVEALQCPLMVMSGPCYSSKPTKPNHISFLTQNLYIYMVSLNMDLRVKNIYYFGCDISNFYIFSNHRIHESITTCPSSCTSLTSNSGWEW